PLRTDCRRFPSPIPKGEGQAVRGPFLASSNCPQARRPPNNLAGRKKSARINASMPSTTMPSIRNGIESSHTTGNKTTSNSNNGQHSTHRSAQPITRSIRLILGLLYRTLSVRQCFERGEDPQMDTSKYADIRV